MRGEAQFGPVSKARCDHGLIDCERLSRWHGWGPRRPRVVAGKDASGIANPRMTTERLPPAPRDPTTQAVTTRQGLP